jgi:hypothetical protein
LINEAGNGRLLINASSKGEEIINSAPPRCGASIFVFLYILKEKRRRGFAKERESVYIGVRSVGDAD